MNIFEQGLSRYLTPGQRDALGRVLVGIAGAGGIGSNVAQCLVRTGVMRLRIVDFDTVDPSNLNRQFYFIDQTGKPKVIALKENLLRVNPCLDVDAIAERVDRENALRLFGGCDLIVEALDIATEKMSLVSSAVSAGIPVLAVSGIAGWGDSDSIRIRRLQSGCTVIGDCTSDISAAPPLAPRVALAAAKIADEVIAAVLDRQGNA